MTALAAAAPAGHGADPITVILLLIAVAAGYAVSLYVRPVRSCPRCHGTRLTGTGRRTRGWGRCGGTGHIRRIGATAVHRLYWSALGDQHRQRRRADPGQRRHTPKPPGQ